MYDEYDRASSRCVKFQLVEGTACAELDSFRFSARRCLHENETSNAVDYLRAVLACNSTDISALQTLSGIFVHTLGTPAQALELLQPHYAAENATQVRPFLADVVLTCTYLQALVRDSATSRTVLQVVERLQQEGIPLDVCMRSVHIEALYELKYYVDAYQSGTEFVQKYPELPASHAWMGQTLHALRRPEEATAVLLVARTLVREDVRWDADVPLLKRLGDALFSVNASEAAADMYARVLPRMHSSPVLRDQRCAVMLRQGKLHLELNRTHSAYVGMLQCIRDCPETPFATLYLGMAQHQLGLFHHAADMLKIALKHKATKAEARTAIKALKATREAILAEQVRLAEEALGPKPPLDPTIERVQQTESYIDYMARVRKQEKEEKERTEKLERERIATEHAAASAAVTGVDAGSVDTHTSVEATHAGAASENVNATHDPADPVSVLSSGMSTASVTAPSAELSDEEAAARNVADQFVIMAAAFTKKEDYPQALKQLSKAVKRAPTYATPYVQRAQVHLAMENVALAVADLLKVCTELDNTDSASRERLVQIAAEMALAGRSAEAEGILQPLNAQLPTDEAFCLGHATALARQGDLLGAVSGLQRMGDAAIAASPQAQRLLTQLRGLSGGQVAATAVDGATGDAQAAAEQQGEREVENPGNAAAAGSAGRHRRGGSRWVRHAAEGSPTTAIDPTAAAVAVEGEPSPVQP